MPYSFVASLMILTTVLLSACTQTEMAALDDKSGIYAGRSATAGVGGFTPTYEARYTPPVSIDTIASQDLTPISTAPAHAAPVVTSPVAPQSTLSQPIIQPTITWAWPVDGTVTSGFGKQSEGISNEGVVIAAPSNTPIHAAAQGEVAYVGNNVRDYGNMVILRHANGDMTSYAHADRIIVAKGMVVRQGDTIGYVGNSGRAKTAQLHFAMRSGNQAVDPLSRLPSQLASR